MRFLPEQTSPILVTGGVGFIGSNFVMSLLERGNAVVTLDSLSYAANPHTLKILEAEDNHQVVQGSITDRDLLDELFDRYRPSAVVNFAAESHVDRSIDSATAFWMTNVGGTCSLLEAALRYWRMLGDGERRDFRFLQISTDEVFGSVSSGSCAETSAYRPNSPYAASKAAADHFVRAYQRTHGLPTLVTHSVNNYGPYHFPEKLIPLTILSAIEERQLPVYGDGQNVREWIYVRDNCEAIARVLQFGRPGDTYNIGSGEERTNLSVVESLCGILDRLKPRSGGLPYRNLITFVEDRPGHDFRYSLDSAKVREAVGWAPSVPFETALEHTVLWYLSNESWWRDIWERRYRGERLGLVQGASR